MEKVLSLIPSNDAPLKGTQRRHPPSDLNGCAGVRHYLQASRLPKFQLGYLTLGLFKTWTRLDPNSWEKSFCFKSCTEGEKSLPCMVFLIIVLGSAIQFPVALAAVSSSLTLALLSSDPISPSSIMQRETNCRGHLSNTQLCPLVMVMMALARTSTAASQHTVCLGHPCKMRKQWVPIIAQR